MRENEAQVYREPGVHVYIGLVLLVVLEAIKLILWVLLIICVILLSGLWTVLASDLTMSPLPLHWVPVRPYRSLQIPHIGSHFNRGYLFPGPWLLWSPL